MAALHTVLTNRQAASAPGESSSASAVVKSCSLGNGKEMRRMCFTLHSQATQF